MDTVLFDLGGVLIDWNPRYLYRPLFDGDDAAMEDFLARVCPPEWNHQMDEGKPFAQAVAERQRLYPEHAPLIAQWQEGWSRMLREEIHGTVAILGELRSRGVRLLALTNWSAETFPIAQARYPFLAWFEDIVVSGKVALAKPDPRIFELTVQRTGLDPAATLFTDDSPRNIKAARACGLHAELFTGPDRLRATLEAFQLL